MTEGPGTINRRRRSSSSSAAQCDALVVASATGSSHSRISRRAQPSKWPKAERLTQSVELLVAGLEPGRVGGERQGSSAELFGNETKRRSGTASPGRSSRPG